MLCLILMRHAEAVQSRAGGDHERPLSKPGMREAEASGHALVEAHLEPELILASDSRRTRETAERVAAVLAVPPSIRTDRRLYGASPDTILDVLRETPPAVTRVLMIGHNPGLGDCARGLAGTGEADALAALAAHFPTGCWAEIHIDRPSFAAVEDGERGRLVRLHGGKRP